MDFNEFLDNLTEKYIRKQNWYTYQFIRIYSKTYEDIFLPLKNKFTEHYSRMIYARLYPLRLRRLYSFYTLTIRNTGSIKNDNDRIRKGWKSFRSIMSRVGIKKPSYLKVYELTEKYVIHIHVAFFCGFTQVQHEELFRYWNSNYGFVKCIRFSDFRQERHPLAEFLAGKDVVTYSKSWKSWYLTKQEILTWNMKGETRNDGKALSYVMKYMIKEPSLRKQAYIKYLRLRSYELSRDLSALIKSFKEKFVQENKLEFMGVTMLDFSSHEEKWLSGIVLEKYEFDKIVENSEYKRQLIRRVLVKPIICDLTLPLNYEDKSSIFFTSTCTIYRNSIVFDPIFYTA